MGDLLLLLIVILREPESFGQGSVWSFPHEVAGDARTAFFIVALEINEAIAAHTQRGGPLM
jgi:hypothetical protein